MEKAPMYTVMASTHPPCKRQWMTWAGAGVALVALVVAGVTASMAVRQMDRATQMEGKLMEIEGRMVELEGHMLEVLEYSLSTHDYFDYEGDDQADHDPSAHDNSQPGPYEHLTVQRVVRRRRHANSVQTDDQPVPIYDQAYGGSLRGRSNSEGLRLYESLQHTRGQGDPTSPEVTLEATESPIKPYHRDGLLDATGSIVWPLQNEISNLWVPKNSRRRYPASSLSTRNLDHDDDTISGKINRRRAAVTERRSRTKATSRHDGFDSGQNSVVPQPPPLPESPGARVVVDQGSRVVFSSGQTTGYTNRPATHLTKDVSRKRRPRKRRGGRRRRSRSVMSLAHFVASTTNSTRHGSGSAPHHAWTPAAWMDKLGLNRKYPVDQDTVVVKEAGLYYLYAQVLYESGRFGSGFQILVDDIPIMECTLAPAQPSHSCHTAGASYLPRHAAVTVKDLDQHTRPVRSHHNTFFGLVKLMDAPDSAEQLLLP